MLNQDEFKSLWEIAFRWEHMEPPQNDPSTLPEGVKKKIEQMIWAFRRDRVVLRHASGAPVRTIKDSMFELLFLDWSVIRFSQCLRKKIYPYSFLSKRFAYRAEILQWCEAEYIEPPEFWMGDSQNSFDDPRETQITSILGPEQTAFLETLVNGKHRQKNSKFDSMICQAIARTLWDVHPYLTIEDMKKHKAIQIYGNGRAYSGKNTLRDWLSPVDPRPPETKTGRKKKNGSD